MRNRFAMLVVTGVGGLTISVGSQGANSVGSQRASISSEVRDIMECSVEMNAARHEGVDNISIDLTMLGHEVTQYLEKTRVTDANGDTHDTYRLVPPNEISKGTSAAGAMATPELLEAYAEGYERLGEALDGEISQSGVPAGIMSASGSRATMETAIESADNTAPWASPNPRVMTGAMAKMLRDAAEAERNSDDGTADAAGDVNDMSVFFENARKVGTETIDNRSADHLRAEGLNHTQSSDGSEFTINAYSLWFDQEECVPLKFRMEGVANSQGESRDVFIEGHNYDYRSDPTNSLYESRRQVVRMGGVLSPSEMAEMEDARVQLAQFEQELAAMPANQQTVVNKMMGPQMEMMRKMVETGAFEVETIVRAIRVNEGVEGALGHSGGAFGLMPTAPTAPAPTVTTAAPAADGLVQMIQRDLLSLGYDPGNTNGELTKATVVAISRYQAVKGMEVTGQPTPQLAGILSAAVDAQN